MITHSQISDFAKRKVEQVEKLSGRTLTDQERSQCRAFFNAFGRDFKSHRDGDRPWNSKRFWDINAPEIVKSCGVK